MHDYVSLEETFYVQRRRKLKDGNITGTMQEVLVERHTFALISLEVAWQPLSDCVALEAPVLGKAVAFCTFLVSALLAADGCWPTDMSPCPEWKCGCYGCASSIFQQSESTKLGEDEVSVPKLRRG